MFVKLVRNSIILLVIAALYVATPINYNLDIKGSISKDNLTYTLYKMKVLEYIVDRNDTITLNVDSPGGSLFLTMSILNFLDKTPAKTIAHIETLAASGAALIVVECDEVTSDKYSSVLFHRPYTFSILSGKKLVQPGELGYALNDKLVRKHLWKILTLEELVLYYKGKDVVITGTDLIKRLRSQ